MANKRFADNPQLSALKGSELIPATSVEAGIDTSTNPIAAGTDIRIKLADALGLHVNTVSVAGGVAVVDCGFGLNRHHRLSLTGNATLSLSNIAPSGYVTEGEIRIDQDATGGRVLTLPASFKHLGGSDTTVAAAANAVTTISFKSFNDGLTFEYAMQESV